MGNGATVSCERAGVGFFVSCLVDFFRPSVGLAAVRLLEAAGCNVEIPMAQTCCGQPAWNNGEPEAARAIARQVIDTFEPYEHVVVPSGSCAGMVRLEYPRALANDDGYGGRAIDLAARTWELTSFLGDVLGIESTSGTFAAEVVFHDACAGLRELDIHAQPRRLLRSMKGLVLKEMNDPESCCGFGGTFCVKFPEVSEKMVAGKVRSVSETGASVLTGCDLGCLLNMAGRLSREGKQLRVLHVAEVLAGDMDTPGLGEADVGGKGDVS